MFLIRKKVVTTVNVLYYLPDYNNLVNEFIWQTMDRPPEFKRIHRFLNYWKDHIDAVIKEVLLTHEGKDICRLV